MQYNIYRTFAFCEIFRPVMNIEKIKNNKTIQTFFSSRNLGLYLFLIISLSVAWSTAKIIQKNYELQKDITQLQQEVALQEQQNKNQALKNKYFETDTFLELGARKYFSKSLPGERIYSVPKDVAMANVKPMPSTILISKKTKTKAKVLQNWSDWLIFLQGKASQQTSD